MTLARSSSRRTGSSRVPVRQLHPTVDATLPTQLIELI